jgi:hypothetical protein
MYNHLDLMKIIKKSIILHFINWRNINQQNYSLFAQLQLLLIDFYPDSKWRLQIILFLLFQLYL